jgi:actin-binding protein IPP
MEGPSLNLPRCGLGVCTSDGKIYAFGGWVGSQLGDSIEMYDSNRGDWLLYAQIPRPKFACGVVEVDGKI